jgi:hypothetical protein
VSGGWWAREAQFYVVYNFAEAQMADVVCSALFLVVDRLLWWTGRFQVHRVLLLVEHVLNMCFVTPSRLVRKAALVPSTGLLASQASE